MKVKKVTKFVLKRLKKNQTTKNGRAGVGRGGEGKGGWVGKKVSLRWDVVKKGNS
jgi:hypothetical protein